MWPDARRMLFLQQDSFGETAGEGAGYAGGITSAAMDGLKTAEEIAKKYMNFS